MKLLSALILKLMAQSVVLGVLLPWRLGLGAGPTTLAVLVIWLGSYLLVDALVLPAAGCAAAAVADFALVALVLAAMTHAVSTAALGAAAAAGLVEYGFHVYLVRHGLGGPRTL